MNKIANVENVVCSAETKARHQELFHYTNQAAFEGIVASRNLWCSHYKSVADSSEVYLMRDLLSKAVAPIMDSIIEQGYNRHVRRMWKSFGGGEQTARDLVNSLYGATFDGKATYSTLEAFLFSFSTHSGDTAFEREHGVGCQWRAYAGADGYCLVFDVNAVAEMLKHEGNLRYWAWLMLEPVRYADSPVEEIFPELVQGLANMLPVLIKRTAVPDDAAKQFLIGSTLLKAPSYRSEREIRIIAIPGTSAMAKLAAKEYPDEFDAAAPLPETRLRPDNRRYVALFDGLGRRLPIKRVIVGPGANQDQRAERAKRLLPDVPVTLSLCE